MQYQERKCRVSDMESVAIIANRVCPYLVAELHLVAELRRMREGKQ
jgi:hypothetical protein